MQAGGWQGLLQEGLLKPELTPEKREEEEGGSGEPGNRCKQTTEAEPVACPRKAGAEGEQGKHPGPQDQKPSRAGPATCACDYL